MFFSPVPSTWSCVQFEEKVSSFKVVFHFCFSFHFELLCKVSTPPPPPPPLLGGVGGWVGRGGVGVGLFLIKSIISMGCVCVWGGGGGGA